MSEKSVMSAKDIAVIIKACAESGVRQLFFGDLELYLGQEKEISHQPNVSTDLELPTAPFVLEPTSKTKDKPDADEDIDLLHITDPVQWEILNTKSE